jgi:hypothetical protein
VNQHRRQPPAANALSRTLSSHLQLTYDLVQGTLGPALSAYDKRIAVAFIDLGRARQEIVAVDALLRVSLGTLPETHCQSSSAISN